MYNGNMYYTSVKRNVVVPLQSLGGKSQARLQAGMQAANVNQLNKA